MIKIIVITAFACFLIILPSGGKVRAQEILTHTARIRFEGDEDLRQFNKRVKLGTFSFRFGRQNRVTMADEVKNKLSLTITQVQEILEMFPRGMKFDIVLLPSKKEVRRIYWEQFNREVKFIAFYSTKTNTVYLSVQDVNISILAHELAHVVINHYFENAPPVKIHEVLAQYVESQMRSQ